MTSDGCCILVDWISPQNIIVDCVPSQNILDLKQPQDAKIIHVLSSGIKAAATWWRVEGLQACRECCGGQGFLAANQIGPLATDMNVDVTFEGANTVLMQQVRFRHEMRSACHSYTSVRTVGNFAFLSWMYIML
jgi:hypothetical protein